MKKVLGILAVGIFLVSTSVTASNETPRVEEATVGCYDFMSSCGQAGFMCGSVDAVTIMAFDEYLCG